MSEAPAFDLGHGLTSTSAPTLAEALRCVLFQVEDLEYRHARRVETLGNPPNAVDLYCIASLRLAVRILEDVQEHRDAVRETIKREKMRIAREQEAENAKAARVQAAIARRRREEREEKVAEQMPEAVNG